MPLGEHEVITHELGGANAAVATLALSPDYSVSPPPSPPIQHRGRHARLSPVSVRPPRCHVSLQRGNTNEVVMGGSDGRLVLKTKSFW